MPDTPPKRPGPLSKTSPKGATATGGNGRTGGSQPQPQAQTTPDRNGNVQDLNRSAHSPPTRNANVPSLPNRGNSVVPHPNTNGTPANIGTAPAASGSGGHLSKPSLTARREQMFMEWMHKRQALYQAAYSAAGSQPQLQAQGPSNSVTTATTRTTNGNSMPGSSLILPTTSHHQGVQSNSTPAICPVHGTHHTKTIPTPARPGVPQGIFMELQRRAIALRQLQSANSAAGPSTSNSTTAYLHKNGQLVSVAYSGSGSGTITVSSGAAATSAPAGGPASAPPIGTTLAMRSTVFQQIQALKQLKAAQQGTAQYGKASTLNLQKVISTVEPPFPILLPPVTHLPPCPPNWASSLREAVPVQSPFIKTPVERTSAEYAELSRLFGSAGITIADAERIVNPGMWRRFIRARADLLASKSEDLSLLGALGLSEDEVAEKTHIALNFDKSHLNGSPYCDNVVLLFHGCKSHASLERILGQGLDERLGNAIGHLGRGIYFADDPRKAMQYDTIGVLVVCAVMLGDCAAIHGMGGLGIGTVREPEKTGKQRRNQYDLFFDSIVGRPTGKCNEYIVYNRTQCCPLYTIAYDKARSTLANEHGTSDQQLVTARSQLPSFAWNRPDEQQVHVKNRAAVTPSPLYASRIFRAMAADIDQSGTEDMDTDDNSSPTDEPLLARKLWQLKEMGFEDEEKNKTLLLQFDLDVDKAVEHLLRDEAREELTAKALGNGSVSGDGTAMDVTESDSEAPSSSKRSCIAIATGVASHTGVGGAVIAGPSTSAAAMGATANSAGSSADTPDWLAAFLIDYDVKPQDMLVNPTGLRTSDPNAAGGQAQVQAQGGGHMGHVLSSSSTSSTEVVKAEPSMAVPQQQQQQPPPATVGDEGSKEEATPPQQKIAKIAKIDNEDCPICITEYPAGGSDWETLECGHKLCKSCCDKLKSTGTTMSGTTHPFLKCPFCQSFTGIEIGTCPDGAMTVLKLSASAAGYDGYGSLSIRYYVNTWKYFLDRTAYLPDNAEGQRVLALLRTAWDRRLCFSIGTSITTGQTNVVVWNIHHKTSLIGGTHGYPDPTYLERVTQELRQHGIE